MVAFTVVVRLSSEDGSREAAQEALPAPDDTRCSSEKYVMAGRGWNQLLLKSKKQRSDQLQEVMNKIRRRNEQ